MRRALQLVALVCLFTGAAFGQGALYYDRVQAVDGRAIGGVTVTICAYSSGQYNSMGQYTGAIPCASPVTAYYDPALSLPITPPILTDSQGNILVYLNAGTYTVTYSALNITPRGFPIVLGCAPNSTTMGCVAGGNPGNPNTSIQTNQGGVFTGDSRFTFNVSTGNQTVPLLENTRYVDPANSQAWAGSDIGAWINSAYANLPASGGRIHVAPASNGACINFSTPIVLTVNVKIGILEGDLNATCLNYTPLTGTAISISWGSTHYPSYALSGIKLTGAGAGNSTVGINLGSTAALDQAVVANSYVSGFGTGLLMSNSSFNTTIRESEFINNGTGVNTINELSRIVDSNISQNVTGLLANDLSDINLDGDSFDDNSTVAININQAFVALEGYHFENAGHGTSQYITYIGGYLWMGGGEMLDDTLTGTQAQMTTIGGVGQAFFYIGHPFVFSSGRTVTDVVNITNTLGGGGEISIANSTPGSILADYVVTGAGQFRIFDSSQYGSSTGTVSYNVGNFLLQDPFATNNPRYYLRSNDANTSDRVIDLSGTGGSAFLRLYKSAKGTDTTASFATWDTNANLINYGNISFANTGILGTLTHANSVNRTYTFPDATGIVCLSTVVTSGCGGGGGITLATNGVNNGSQTFLNFITSSTNADGLVVTPYNSGGTEKFEITGPLYYQTFQVGGTPVTQETTANFVAGTNMTITPSIVSGVTTLTFAASATAATAFSSLTPSTNSNTGNFVIVGGNWDFSSGTWRAPTGSGYAPTANGVFGYNSLTNLYAFGQNGSTLTLSQTQAPSSGTFLSGYNAATGAFSTASNAATATLAATATAAATTPTLCSSDQAPTGVTVNFNATGCTTYALATLGNLASVAVPVALNPASDATIALDSFAKRYTIGYFSSGIQNGAACTPLTLGTGAGGVCMVESTSSGWTPTVGYDYFRSDSTLNQIVASFNGGAESPVATEANTLTFTNKTFNTAATGNIFQINGTSITGISGNTATLANATSGLHGAAAGVPTCADGNGNVGITGCGGNGYSCAMSSATSCTATVASVTAPICIAADQKSGGGVANVGCNVSGTTATVYAASSNSDTWGIVLAGTPSSITFDGAASTNSGSSVITWNHTVTSNTNGILCVGIGIIDTANTAIVSTITYNVSTSLTKIVSYPSGSAFTANNNRTEIWCALAPPTGTHQVAVTLATAPAQEADAGSVSLTGVHQSLTVDSTNGAFSGSGQPNGTTTTVAANAWVMDAVADNGADNGSLAATSPSVERWNNGNNRAGAGSTQPTTSAGSKTMAWTGLTAAWAQSIISLAPGP